MKKQVVLITGGSAGMGKVTAQRLNQAGYTVYTGARRVERMEDIAAQGVHTFKLDVTNDDSMKAAVQQIIDQEGRIDVLINNAGYGEFGAIEDVSIANAKQQFEVNIFGLARMTQLVLPYMRAQHYGKIINISSIGGKIYEPLGGWYHASKFALEGFSDSLRVEVKQFGIDVVVIQPGGIRTEWSGIAGDSLMKTSGHTPYADLAQSMSRMFNNIDGGSEPEVIAEVIEKAIASSSPKTRYSAGYGAKPILFMRKVLSDKAFDRLIMMTMKFLGKSNQEIAQQRAETQTK